MVLLVFLAWSDAQKVIVTEVTKQTKHCYFIVIPDLVTSVTEGVGTILVGVRHTAAMS